MYMHYVDTYYAYGATRLGRYLGSRLLPSCRSFWYVEIRIVGKYECMKGIFGRLNYNSPWDFISFSNCCLIFMDSGSATIDKVPDFEAGVAWDDYQRL